MPPEIDFASGSLSAFFAEDLALLSDLRVKIQAVEQGLEKKTESKAGGRGKKQLLGVSRCFIDFSRVCPDFLRVFSRFFLEFFFI